MKRILLILMVVLSFGFLLTACNNDKKSDLAENEVYSCPMHPQIVREEPGQCPICNMDLEKRKGTPAELQKLKKS